MAILEANTDLDVKGRLLATDVPNSTGSIVTWNANTNVFGLRTDTQIISDLGLTSVVSNSHTHTNKLILDGITSTNISNWNTAYNSIISNISPQFNGDLTLVRPNASDINRKIKSIQVLDTRGGWDNSDGTNSYMPNPNDSNLDKSLTGTFSTDWGGSSWGGVLTMKAWGTSYAAWQISGAANHNRTSNDFYLRSGVNDTWDSWNRIWHSGDFDIADYATESWVNSNFDNYQSWNLKTNNTQRTTVQSGGTLDLVAGTNVSIGYSAGGVVTINSTDTDTTYSAGTGLSLTGTTFANTAPNATHTGDVTGATALTIANNAVTHAKYQNIPTQRILGRGATGTGNVQELTLGANLSLSTTGVLSATNTNTTYSAGTGLSLSGTTFNVNYGTSSGTSAQGNDSRINNGQTAFGWGNHASQGYLTSLPSHSINTHSDVNITTPSNGQVLKYDNGSWVNVADETGDNNYVNSISFNTGTGVLTLGRQGLSDLTEDLDGRYSLTSHTHTTSDITNLSSYTGFDSRYYTETEVDDLLDDYSLTSHNHTLDSLSNVTITSNTSGEILKWNGSAWINNTLAQAGIASSSHTHSNLSTGTGLTGSTYNGGTARTFAFDTTWGDNRYALDSHNHDGRYASSNKNYLPLSGDTFTTGDDLDTLKFTGILEYDTNVSNKPTTAGGALFSSARNTSNGFQIAGSVTADDEMFFRKMSGGTYGSWFRVASREWSTSQFSLSSHTHSASDITSGTIAYARLPFSSTDVGNWNEAYGWGNHGAQGYLTSNQTITLSGDVSGSGSTSISVTIASNAVEAGMLNNNIISGKTALTSGLASTDELMISDGGVIKRMDVSVLQTYMQSNLAFSNNSGTVTSVATGTGLTGGTITSTGTISLNASSISSLALADTSLQPGDDISELNNDVGYTTNVGTVTSVLGGNGLTGGGTSSVGISMGTPSAITLSSTNSTTSSSHTHAFTPGGTANQFIDGTGSLQNLSTLTPTLDEVLNANNQTDGHIEIVSDINNPTQNPRMFIGVDSITAIDTNKTFIIQAGNSNYAIIGLTGSTNGGFVFHQNESTVKAGISTDNRIKAAPAMNSDELMTIGQSARTTHINELDQIGFFNLSGSNGATTNTVIFTYDSPSNGYYELTLSGGILGKIYTFIFTIFEGQVNQDIYLCDGSVHNQFDPFPPGTVLNLQYDDINKNWWEIGGWTP